MAARHLHNDPLSRGPLLEWGDHPSRQVFPVGDNSLG